MSQISIPADASTAGKPPFELFCSRQFTAWLTEQRVSLAFSTYQTGKLFLLGVKPDGGLSVFERTFNRCLGLWSDGQTIWMSSLYQLWRFENVLEAGQLSEGFDRLYVPRMGYITGDLDVHDVAVDANGEVIFVNTLFGCLAMTSLRYNFEPLWRPTFLSKLTAEDRCHLNGLAMEQGQPRYVTACSQTDVVDGWRDSRVDGGCVLDVSSGEVVARGLSMPHSPRLYRDRLWLLESGRGNFGFVDRSTGRFETVAFCPGYPRGLTFVGHDAVVGVSKPREKTFAGLPLDDELARRNATAQCGLYVIDLDSGDVRHWLRIEGVVEELYDVVVLPEVRRPKALGFKTDEIRHNVWFASDGRTNQWIGQSS